MHAFSRVAVATAFGLSLSAALAMPTLAAAEGDNTPPTLTTPVKASFVVGSQVSQWTNFRGDNYSSLPERIGWETQPDNGFTPLVSIYEHDRGQDPRLLGLFVSGNSFDVTASDFIPDEDAPITNWSVQARDQSDNATEHAVYGALISVKQDNGTVGAAQFRPGLKLTFKGDWKQQTCSCYLAGTTHNSTTKGDVALIHFTVRDTDVLRRVALISQVGPHRGSAMVSIDGGTPRLLSTNAVQTRNRVVVWQARLGVGAHTIRIVNQATAKHPQFDVDAYVIN